MAKRNNTRALAAVILAAGKGTRMCSSLPKVMHEIFETPMLHHICKSILNLNVQKLVAVASPESNFRLNALEQSLITEAVQHHQHGTADAVNCTQDHFGDFSGDILILCGDTPCIQTKTLRNLVQHHQQSSAIVSFISFTASPPTGYGRVLRDDSGSVLGIIEERDANTTEKLITEVNSGIYIVDATFLFSALSRVQSHNNQNELYLTDIVSIASADQHTVNALHIAEADDLLGVNTMAQLAQAETVLRQRIRNRHLLKGVRFIDPNSSYIDPEVVIGHNCIIHPCTHILGNSTIGDNCTVGPNCTIQNYHVAAHQNIEAQSFLKS